jgi:formyltetrahydrofolate deformylase
MNKAILLISCADQKGITASVTNFVFSHQGNILHADQHIDEQSNTFFMRIEWSMEGFKLKKDQIHEKFKAVGRVFDMQWNLYFSDEKPRVAIFVSKYLHCLYDLLYRYKTEQFSCSIPLIISNHSDAKSVAKEFGIKFVEMVMLKENKKEQEKRQMDILKEEKIDLVVLARYHQILTAQFVQKYSNKIINIHHSFLPAFVGKNPYAQAFEKGVKIIGATSHFVTEALDQGPIIEQDTVRVSHRDTLVALKQKGEDLERVVLSRAVKWHLERKILVYNNKTVVFD